MLLQCLRALCEAPGGPGSIWKYLEALVRATGESGRFACGFRTDLYFADALIAACLLSGDRDCQCPISVSPGLRSRCCRWVGNLCCSPFLISPLVLQVLIPHPAFGSPN